jgi:hypothetical protein
MAGVELCFSTDQFGRLTCDVAHGAESAVVTASDRPQAIAGLTAALDTLERNGIAECYWHEGGGEYRWVFRRENSIVRIAILWSTGTLTGWEHVFFGECDRDEFVTLVRRELDGVPIG